MIHSLNHPKRKFKILTIDNIMRVLLILVLIPLPIAAIDEWIEIEQEFKKSEQWRIDNFYGKHELRKIMMETGKESHLSGGGFFAFGFGIMNTDVGKYPGSENIHFIRFAWKFRSQYIISEIPTHKVRFIIEDKYSVPMVEFHGQYTECKSYDPQDYATDGWKCNLSYIVIYCKSENFPMKVN